MEEALILAELGRPAAALGLYGLSALAVAGAMPRAAERIAAKARASRGAKDPGRYGGLELYRLEVNKGQTIEPERVAEALGALALGAQDGVYLELHVGEYTDVVVAGRGIAPAVSALRAHHQGRVNFVRVDPEEDAFAPPMEEAVRSVVGGVPPARAEGEGPDAPSSSGGMTEVCLGYRVKGVEGWGTRALSDFARGAGDPVDAGLSQVRAALEVDRGEAALIQLHLRPATKESEDLGQLADHNKKKPTARKASLVGDALFLTLPNRTRDFMLRRSGTVLAATDQEPRETPEARRIAGRAAGRLYEVSLVAYGRTMKGRERRVVEAFDKYFASYEERGGAKGGSRLSGRDARGSVLRTLLRMPVAPPGRWDHAPVMNPSEIAAMWHPLGADAQVPGRREALVITLPPPAALPKKGVAVARSNFVGMERPVKLDHETLCRHGRLLGVPGVGKTAALYRLGEAILTTPGARGQKMGMFCLDPKNDLFTVLLENVGRFGRAEDTIVLDPGDARFRVPGMNVLAPQGWMTERKQAQVLVGAFRTRFASIGWGAKMEEFMTQALHALVAANRVLKEELGGEPRYTVLDLSSARFLAPKLEAGKDEWEPAPMRAEVLRVLRASREAHRYADLMRFWESFDANYRASAQKTEINPVTNKINQLLTDAIIPVFGAPHCDIDFLSMMSEGKVFLANLSKNTFGKDGSRLFGSLLMNLSLAASQYRHEQIKRGTFAGKATEFVYLVDEVQDFTCPEMCDIINQGRAYRTPLWVAHQEMRQIQDEEIDAAFEGVGTSIYFCTDPKDAKRVSRVLGEPFNEPVMANFAKHNFVIRGDGMRVTCSTLRLPDEETEAQREAAHERAIEARRISAELYATEWDPEAEERRRAERYGGRRAAIPGVAEDGPSSGPRGPEDFGDPGPGALGSGRDGGSASATGGEVAPPHASSDESEEQEEEDADLGGIAEALGDLDDFADDDDEDDDDDGGFGA